MKSDRSLVFMCLLAVVLGSGCKTFSPMDFDAVGFKERATTQTKDGVTASVVVLTAEEAKAAFDCKLYKKKIQPVWIEITNDTKEEMLFMPRSVDPDYFAPLEVAQKTSWTWNKKANIAKKYYYYENNMSFLIPPGETKNGFVYTNRSKGVKWVLVEVFSKEKQVHVEFVTEIPGFRADYHKFGEGDIYHEILRGPGDHRLYGRIRLQEVDRGAARDGQKPRWNQDRRSPQSGDHR